MQPQQSPDVFPKSAINLGTLNRAEIRELLFRKYHVDALLVGVPKLSSILGLSPSTIYGYIRAGNFFLPYRVINRSPMVRVDDVVDWYCGSPESVCPAPLKNELAAVPKSDSPHAFEDDLVERTLRTMGLSPRQRRGK